MSNQLSGGFIVNKQIQLLVTFAAALCAAPAAHAQFAVIDVASLTQLISEVQTLEQQLATAQNQLVQAQAEYRSITGARGMEQLLAGTPRNYLPPNWTTLEGAMQGSAAYPALASDLRAALRATTVLSAAQLAALSPAAAAQLQSRRQNVALLESVSHEALANSSGRFAAVQQLIDTIAHASDQKSILELQARVSAEQGMLQNEHTKLQVLDQGMRAQQWASEQQARELTIAGHGQFDSRFQPHP
jgi:type IV secretion system protein VirB5